MFKNALVSVSDKSGLIEFLKPLQAKGLRIVSTGGTSQHLKDAGLAVVDIKDHTGYPEVMDGRVRTLHPRIHMALLARSFVPADHELLRKEGLEPFDLVIGNLYPFEEALQKGFKDQELIEYIDIGGPSLLRSAAKSFERITVVCDPRDYARILENGADLAARRALAAKVFAHTSTYDSMVAEELGLSSEAFDRSWGGYRKGELRYGENSHQTAGWYRAAGSTWGLHQARVLQGKALSYNNLLDLDAACHALRMMGGIGVVGVKHNNPCGAATGADAVSCMDRALKADPVSIFGGIVASSYVVDREMAQLLGDLFLECVVAPGFSPDAIAVLEKKKNLRLLEWKQMLEGSPKGEVRSVAGGYLYQQADQRELWSPDWEIVGQEPSLLIQNEMMFAWGVCAALKSNAICITSDLQTRGLGMGQVNRVDAVEQAITRWKRFHPKAEKVVLASDAFFPFPDSIELAARAGVAWVIQPGGSMKDAEVKKAAELNGVNMVMTGRRHFRH